LATLPVLSVHPVRATLAWSFLIASAAAVMAALATGPIVAEPVSKYALNGYPAALHRAVSGAVTGWPLSY